MESRKTADTAIDGHRSTKESLASSPLLVILSSQKLPFVCTRPSNKFKPLTVVLSLVVASSCKLNLRTDLHWVAQRTRKS